MKIWITVSLLLLLASTAKSATTVYVDAQATVNGDGSSSTPFNNIASALANLVDGTFRLSDPDSQVILLSATKPYPVAGIKILGPAGASFTISASVTSSLQSQNYPCNTLPSLEFSAAADFENLGTVQFTGVTVSFQGEQSWGLKSIAAFNVNSSCLDLTGWSTTSGAAIQADSVSNLVIGDASIETGPAIQLLTLTNTNVVITDSQGSFGGSQSTLAGFMISAAFNTTNTFSISGFHLNSKGQNLSYLPKLFNVSAGSAFSIKGFEVNSLNSNATEQMIVVANFSSMVINDISLNNVTINYIDQTGFATGSTGLLEFSGFESFSMNNMTLKGLLLNQTAKSLPTSLVKVKNCYKDCTFPSGNLFITNFTMLSSNIGIGVLYCEEFNQNVLISNFSVTNTIFNQNPFSMTTIYPILDKSSELSSIFLQQNVEISNLSFNSITCWGSLSVFLFGLGRSFGGVLSYGEPIQVRLNNVLVANSTFNSQSIPVIYTIQPASVFTANGIFLNVSSFASSNNTYNYALFLSQSSATSLNLQNSTFQDDTFQNHTIISHQSSFEGVFTSFFEQYIANNSRSPILYRITSLQNNTFSECKFIDLDSLLKTNNPFVIIGGNNFSNCSFSTNATRKRSPVFALGGFTSNMLSYYTAPFTFDSQLQSDAINNDPNLIGSLSMLQRINSDYNTSYSFFIAVTNNTMNAVMLNLVDFLDFKTYIGPHVLVYVGSNLITNTTFSGNDFASFISLEEVANLLIFSNSLVNIQGYYKLVSSIDLPADTAIIIDKANITNSTGLSLIDIENTSLKTIAIRNVNLQNSTMSRRFISLSQIYLKSDLTITNFTANQIVFSVTSRDFGIISISLAKNNVDQSTIFDVSNIQVDSVRYTSQNTSDLPAHGILFLYKTSNSINLTNSSLTNINNDYGENIIQFISKSANVQNFSAMNITSKGNLVVLLFNSVNTTINNSYFWNVTAPETSYGGVMSAGLVGYSQAQQFTVTNTIFKENLGFFGSVVYFMKGKFSISFDNCSFINNPGTDHGVVYLNQISLISFVATRTTVTMNKISREGSWLYLEETSGTLQISDLTANVNSNQTGSLLWVTRSPSINATFVDLKMSSPQFSIPYSPGTRFSPSISLIPSQDVNMFGFATLDSGNLTVIGGDFKRMNLIQYSLLRVIQGSYLPTVTLSQSTFSQIVIVQRQGIYNPMIFLDFANSSAEAAANPSESVKLTISGCTFDNIYSELSGMISMLNSYDIKTSIIISNSNFFSLSASSGSALYLESKVNGSVNCTILSSEFTDNFVTSFGGSIYSSKTNLVIENSIFKSNQAQLQGAAIYYGEPVSDFSDLLSKNTFISNVDFNSVNRNATSPPIGLRLTFDQDNLASNNLRIQQVPGLGYYITNATTSSLQNLTIITQMYTANGDIARDPSKSFAISIVAQNHKTNNRFTTRSGCTSQRCVLSGIKLELSGPTGFNVTINVTYSSELYLLQTSFLMNLRACVPGEIYSSSLEICQVCQAGKFSLNPEDQNCQPCKPGTNCLGGSRVELYPGYWRASPLSEEVYACNDDSDNPRCLGGYEAKCAEAFQGPLCIQCNMTAGYLPSSIVGSCAVCKDSYTTAFDGIWILFYTLLYQIFVITIINSNNSFYIDTIIRKTKKYLPDISPYFNLLTTYCQIMAIVLSISEVFQASTTILQAIGNPNQNAFHAFECFLVNKFSVSFDHIIYYRVVLFTLSPLIRWLLYIFLYSACCKFKLNHERKMRFLCGLVTLIWIEHPGIVNELFAYLQCKDFGAGGLLLTSAPNFSCETDTYSLFKNIVVYPLIVLWTIILPFGFWLYLFLNRKTLDKEPIRYVFGGLFNEYKNEKYYWAAVLIYFKVGLIFLKSVTTADVKTRTLSSFLVLLFYKLATDQMVLFKSDYLNRAQNYTLLAYLSSLLLAYYSEDNPYDSLKVMAICVYIILNGAALLYILFVLLIIFRMQHGSYVRELVRLLLKCDWAGLAKSIFGEKEQQHAVEEAKGNTSEKSDSESESEEGGAEESNEEVSAEEQKQPDTQETKQNPGERRPDSQGANESKRRAGLFSVVSALNPLNAMKQLNQLDDEFMHGIVNEAENEMAQAQQHKEESKGESQHKRKSKKVPTIVSTIYFEDEESRRRYEESLKHANTKEDLSRTQTPIELELTDIKSEVGK